MAGIFVRRISSDANLAFRCDVRISRIYTGTSDHGGAARLVEFRFHAFGMEARARVPRIGFPRNRVVGRVARKLGGRCSAHPSDVFLLWSFAGVQWNGLVGP